MAQEEGSGKGVRQWKGGVGEGVAEDKAELLTSPLAPVLSQPGALPPALLFELASPWLAAQAVGQW